MTIKKLSGWILGLGLVALVAVAAGCGGSSDSGGWTTGRVLLLYIPGVEKVNEVAYLSENGDHFVIRPSQSNKKLAVVSTTVSNQKSARVLLTLDENTAYIGDGKGDRFPMLDPFKNATGVASPGHNEGKYVPFLWGNVELLKGFQVQGWFVFEVPEDFEPSMLLWEETESIRARF